MSKFIMMCGLPGSGKSRLANKLSKEFNATILSSDETRVELFGDINKQDNNSLVFETMNYKAKELLEHCHNVIYDATNTNRKRRMHLINHVFKADEKVTYYMNSHIKTVRYQDSQRERTVGNDGINKMYKTLQIPTKNEGWDRVIIHSSHDNYFFRYRDMLERVILSGFDHDKLFDELGSIILDFDIIFNLPQDSSYHSFSVSRHTYYVYKDVFEHAKEEDKLLLLWAALFHDLGKGFCKSFTNYKGEVKRYANFIGHEFVSSQLAVYWLSLLGYEEEFIKDVANIVQFHMIHNASEKKLNELDKLLGRELLNKLLLLHAADLDAK